MITFQKRMLLTPPPECLWANKMVLNPALLEDPNHPGTIHMLFRASGPWLIGRLAGAPPPYPIFLGYGVSKNNGQDWCFDFTRPALAPTLYYEKKDLPIGRGDYCNANGCVEDPRLFYFEGELFLSVATRAFPPGPYWIADDPEQCMPPWAKEKESGLPASIRQNTTVTRLYKVNLEALASQSYEKAFSYLAPLHEPDICDNRDAFLFPRRLLIDGVEKIIAVHRPAKPWLYSGFEHLKAPSIFLASADRLEDFSTGRHVVQHLLYTPQESWESDRVGASWAPIELTPGEWLFPFHGKAGGKDQHLGYTQSFMILQEQKKGFPIIEKRCSDRLFFASEPWELDGEFQTPCLFTCSGIVRKDGILMMGYGAADTKLGLLETPFEPLVQMLRENDGTGLPTKENFSF